jgi:hypothetical protein
MQSITGIPAAQVGSVVQDFVEDGAARIVVELNDDGTFTVFAAAAGDPGLRPQDSGPRI